MGTFASGSFGAAIAPVTAAPARVAVMVTLLGAEAKAPEGLALVSLVLACLPSNHKGAKRAVGSPAKGGIPVARFVVPDFVVGRGLCDVFLGEKLAFLASSTPRDGEFFAGFLRLPIHVRQLLPGLLEQSLAVWVSINQLVVRVDHHPHPMQ